MSAERTFIRSSFTDGDVSTIGALPNGIIVSGEDQTTLNISNQFPETLFVSSLYICNILKKSGYFIKAFFFGYFLESWVHTEGTCPFIDKYLVYAIQTIYLRRTTVLYNKLVKK